MTIYQEILQWSASRPDFIKDSLRRIIVSQTLSQNDIDEITLLLKKDEGATDISLVSIPLDASHLPTNIALGLNYPKLISINNPENICALYDQANLEFTNSGLIVVYGNNGSGKSSYSRILKKLCWSRDKSIDLKRNVFNANTGQQKVNFILEDNGTNQTFNWAEGNPTHPALNSILVFDSNCGDIYVNNENPTEYKPIGIDVLEKLISTLNKVSQSIDIEISQYNTQKPLMVDTLKTTPSGVWYESIESKNKEQVDEYIQFSDSEKERKTELEKLLKTQNPEEKIKTLNEFRTRLNTYFQKFKSIENLFSDENLKEIIELRSNYETIHKAYTTATSELENINLLSGFGTSHWRILWNAAKDFAVKENLTNQEEFPSNESLEKCVLCQQDLDEETKRRLLGFNEFVLNDISIQLQKITELIENKIEAINIIIALPFENYLELNQHIENFQEEYQKFITSFESNKSNIISHLNNGTEINLNKKNLSKTIEELIEKVDKEIKANTELQQNSSKLVAEFNELLAKEYLHGKKTDIVQYHDEFLYKNWLSRCKTKLNTTQVSIKIGDLMSDQAVNLQHREFITHLEYFNQDLATKVSITKTRTASGTTYQKCGFSNIGEGMNAVLSEGEQKIVALSNFLAECTIDNRKNSIVFDDPVNSLDMDYRDLIADKIVSLSSDRQIVVLTHDLSFLRLLIDTHKSKLNTDCEVIGIDKFNGLSGVVTDEIPYLAKNVDERIDSIRRILRDHDALAIHDAHGRETKLDSATKKFRMLIEKTVEEILSNKSYQRFNKNIKLRKDFLSGYIITEERDIDFLLGLFSKYSVTEHDGSTSVISQLPSKNDIQQDITGYLAWKLDFKNRLSAFQQSYN